MLPYQQVDAFKICNELTLRIHPVAKELEDLDPDLGGQLWLTALVASSRVARGTGFLNRRLFAMSVDRTLGALAEMGYYIDMARTLDLISEETQRDIEGLRGRATFYATKLLMSLSADPGQAAGA